jgi:glycosyltransferase involved in cell wall biosynthesis
VYVDSGSADGSTAVARDFGHAVVELSRDKPFTAARARNEGFANLRQSCPDIRLVQFLDGDCKLVSGWLEAAADTLAAREECAIVTGKLLELHPDASVYNRLCQLEWNAPPGDLTDTGAIGGIFMTRVSAFESVGGFNEQVIAGEDSELGVRLGLQGWKITRIDHQMAVHDAEITSFSQWWKRSVRAGHAVGQRAFLNGATAARDCLRERRSTIVWGILLPIAILLLLVPTKGASLVLLGLYGVLAIKVYAHRRAMGDTQADAATYASFLPLAKIANGMGLAKFELNRRANSYSIIEYK